MSSPSYFIKQQNETAVFYQSAAQPRPLPAINTFSPKTKSENKFLHNVTDKSIVDGLDSFNIFDYDMEELIDVALVIFQRMPRNGTTNQTKDDNNDDSDLRLFIQTVRANYFDTVPFHNFRHAVNVLQTLHCFFINIHSHVGERTFAALFPNDKDIFLCYVAALCHDLQHPGVDNNLLAQLNSPLAVRYNYNAILEQHHCSCCFAILDYLMKPKNNNTASSFSRNNNILARYCGAESEDDEAECLKLIAILIGATEVPRHHIIKANIDKVVTALTTTTNNAAASSSAPTLLPRVTETERRDLLCALLEAADISNEVRSNFEGINKKWSVRVQAEFLKSGDALRNAGKPVMDPQNRDKLDIGGGQRFFTNFMCKPLYESLDAYFGVRVFGVVGVEEKDCCGWTKPTIFESCLKNFKINCEENWARVSKEESRAMMQEEEKRIDEEIRVHYQNGDGTSIVNLVKESGVRREREE